MVRKSFKRKINMLNDSNKVSFVFLDSHLLATHKMCFIISCLCFCFIKTCVCHHTIWHSFLSIILEKLLYFFCWNIPPKKLAKKDNDFLRFQTKNLLSWTFFLPKSLNYFLVFAFLFVVHCNFVILYETEIKRTRKFNTV